MVERDRWMCSGIQRRKTCSDVVIGVRAPMELWWTESNGIEAKMLDGEMGTTSEVKERK